MEPYAYRELCYRQGLQIRTRPLGAEEGRTGRDGKRDAGEEEESRWENEGRG